MNFLNDDSSEEYEASSDEEGNGDDNKEKYDAIIFFVAVASHLYHNLGEVKVSLLFFRNEAPVNGIAASLCKDEEKNTTNRLVSSVQISVKAIHV